MRTLLSVFLFLFYFTYPSSQTSRELIFNTNSTKSSSNSTRFMTFIALVDPLCKPSPFFSHHHWYSSLLTSSSSTTSFIHIYNTLIHGFSASLTPYQAKHINSSHGVLSLFPDSIFHLHTTRSPSFLGLNNLKLKLLNSSGSNVIIGFMDTGIWPEHPSFADDGLEPIPAHWRGKCETGFGFNQSNCNKKLIGARFFSGGYRALFGHLDHPASEYRSPRDHDGHGTHVSSIAAGAPVTGSSFYGFAGGLAQGMAPNARIAVYKVCWVSGCLLSDICAAFEKAILDGVNIISISLGSSRLPFYLDLLSIVSLRAFSGGIFVAFSAGNEGPTWASITNAPPWITTVGAGTIDRDFPAKLLLGNGISITGISITLTRESKLTRGFHRLYFGGEISSSKFSFSRQLVKGNIVLCLTTGHMPRMLLGASLLSLGAVAMVICHGSIDPNGIISEPHVIPTITVGILEAKLIEDYILSSDSPVANISSQGTVEKHAKPAPVVAAFSSRGPNSAVPGILKPDVIAPSVNILGAWTDAIGPSSVALDNRRPQFNIMSGTSMACPHVSGVAAIIKSVHPDWGPSEIKSALMTTSNTHKLYYYRNVSLLSSSLILDESTGKAANPFDFGAGHIHPERALDPGLVFDLGYQDYIDFLCELNYTKNEIHIISGKHANCSNIGKGQLNYPAIVVAAEKVGHEGVNFYRRLKNVNEVGSRKYKAKVVGLRGFYKVDVIPKKLKFSKIDEKLSFKIAIRKEKGVAKRNSLWVGALIWHEIGGKHRVRCPIVIFSRQG